MRAGANIDIPFIGKDLDIDVSGATSVVFPKGELMGKPRRQQGTGRIKIVSYMKEKDAVFASVAVTRDNVPIIMAAEDLEDGRVLFLASGLIDSTRVIAQSGQFVLLEMVVIADELILGDEGEFSSVGVPLSISSTP
jgi:hypothetical protein